MKVERIALSSLLAAGALEVPPRLWLWSRPQAQARLKRGIMPAEASAIHEIFTIVSRMKISSGSAGRPDQGCTHR
jgi:hypothetical protein